MSSPGHELRAFFFVSTQRLQQIMMTTHSSEDMLAQVSCYGSDVTSDTGDLWRLEWEGTPHWLRDWPIQVVHKDTGIFLGSHGKRFQRPIAGHTEVCGMTSRGGHSVWRATEGFFWAE